MDFKKKIGARKERKISLALQGLGNDYFLWLGGSAELDDDKEYEKLNAEWKKVAADFVEGDIPELEDMGSEGLGAVMRDFFGRVFTPKG